MTDDECAVGPWTSVRNVEMVSTFLGRKLSTGFVLNPVPEDGRLAFKLATLVTRFDLLSQSVC
jgi:hypothetical protein